ncbi:hypothetical protein JTB14_008923 [Gonioctena quinquepunctata]|nr:hypothetical protein JTB14_008923 [Gonioctena quinquepunctata]
MYADDTQLYYSFKYDEMHHTVGVINEELNYLVKVSNKQALHINIAKCSVIRIERQGSRLKVGDLGIKIGDLPVKNQVRIQETYCIVDAEGM